MLRDLARINGATIVKPAREGRFAGVIALNTVMAKLRELSQTHLGRTTSRPCCAIRSR
jgi:hypothetical protein